MDLDGPFLCRLAANVSVSDHGFELKVKESESVFQIVHYIALDQNVGVVVFPRPEFMESFGKLVELQQAWGNCFASDFTLLSLRHVCL